MAEAPAGRAREDVTIKALLVLVGFVVAGVALLAGVLVVSARSGGDPQDHLTEEADLAEVVASERAGSGSGDG